MSEFETIKSNLQRSADTAIARGGRIVNLIDQAVVETVICNYFRTLPAEPRHIVDVGAAYGAVANVFLKEGWTADLFEPDPACHPYLQKHLARFGPRARLFPHAAAGADIETVAFHQNSIPGLSGLAHSPFGQPHADIQVRAVRLDNFLSSLGVTRVDFLKIDTEGSDFDVLEAHDFANLAPALIFVEYSYFFTGQDLRVISDAVAHMRTRGYDAVIFEYCDDGNFRRNNWAHRLVAIHIDGKNLPTAADAFGNVLFYRSGDAGFVSSFATTLATMA